MEDTAPELVPDSEPKAAPDKLGWKAWGGMWLAVLAPAALVFFSATWPGLAIGVAMLAYVVASALRQDPKGRRRIYLLFMAGSFAASALIRAVFDTTRIDPLCNASVLDNLREGPSPLEVCNFLAREGLIADIMIVVLSVLLVGLALADSRSERPSMWRKLPWFPMTAFYVSPPAVWQDNLAFQLGALALGCVIFGGISFKRRRAKTA